MFVIHPKWRRAGAVNVSRGMLEFRADPESQYHNPAFQQGKTVLTYCASGGRSALAGQTLKEMGYRTVYNIGGLKELADAGLETEAGAQTGPKRRGKTTCGS